MINLTIFARLEVAQMDDPAHLPDIAARGYIDDLTAVSGPFWTGIKLVAEVQIQTLPIAWATIRVKRRGID